MIRRFDPPQKKKLTIQDLLVRDKVWPSLYGPRGIAGKIRCIISLEQKNEWQYTHCKIGPWEYGQYVYLPDAMIKGGETA